MYTFMLRLAGQLLDAAYVVIEQLKGLCHVIENAFNRLQLIDQKKIWLLKHIFNSFWHHFYVLLIKNIIFHPFISVLSYGMKLSM